ncbi:MAG TPA: ABC transporter permease [Solirubrobacteraceae bacterium]|nr:ABC transporter permease [Solirubrobacteraceae bacterium]
MTVTAAVASDLRAPRTGGFAGAWSVFRIERRKLSSQLAVRVLALVCLLGPFVFAAILKVQSGSPSDTLLGIWVHSSGFAVSVVLLAFAGSWGLPVIAGVVAGDMFSAEDRHDTWKLVLTRSCTRRDFFVGKVLAAALFSQALLALTMIASLLAGLLLVGDQSVVSLSGTLFSPGRSLGLVVASWLLCAFPTLAFASLGVLFSVATRNGIAGVIAPPLCALAMQLLLLVGSGFIMHLLLVGSAFGTWHALFLARPFFGPLLIGIGVSIVWTSVCLWVSWRLVCRRDFAGTAVSRRPGWVVPVRASLAMAVVIALLAIAGNWGPTAVTASRLQTNLAAAFNSLTILQQQELGRRVPPGASLNIVPTCSRRGSTPRGPGDWVCTMTLYTPQPGANPFQQTPVSYDVSVQSDGCYKAQSPPAFIGQQLMKAADGRTVVNPLYTIYGCFNPL